MNLIWAFERNCGNHALDDKGDIQVARIIRIRVPRQEAGADQSVVVKKACNVAGAKRLN